MPLGPPGPSTGSGSPLSLLSSRVSQPGFPSNGRIKSPKGIQSFLENSGTEILRNLSTFQDGRFFAALLIFLGVLINSSRC